MIKIYEDSDNMARTIFSGTMYDAITEYGEPIKFCVLEDGTPMRETQSDEPMVKITNDELSKLSNVRMSVGSDSRVSRYGDSYYTGHRIAHNEDIMPYDVAMEVLEED